MSISCFNTTVACLVLATSPEIAAARWTEVPRPIPFERNEAVMAYHTPTGELVLFGGNNAHPPTQKDDTWTFDGAAWTQRDPAAFPSARKFSAMATDLLNGTVVLFGGLDSFGPGGGYLGDTWTWDGTTWTERFPVFHPEPRYGAGMSFDPATGKILLFGGAGPAGTVKDTWLWDGQEWQEVFPATEPLARRYPSLAGHANGGVSILFGGLDLVSGGNLNDTWIWDGTDWSLALPATVPPPRSLAGLAPTASGDLLLYGGTLGTSQVQGDSWIWDGANWTLQPPTAMEPEARSAHALAYHAGSGSIVLFGGRRPDPPGSEYLDDTWYWNGAWSPSGLPVIPSRRDQSGFVYDPVADCVLLFGGYNGMEHLGDTWEWKNGLWTQLSPLTAPEERSLAAMAYHPEGILLFGGSRGGVRLGDTWSWTGANWEMLTPTVSPSARYASAFAYESTRDLVLLFGGNVLNVIEDDTWTWDGSSWQELAPAVSPTPRYRASMAHDPLTGETVLFGGLDAAFQVLNDTWVWDGLSWTELDPSVSPPVRRGARMAFDPLEGAIVLFGGQDDTGIEGYLNDTWCWRNGEWVDLEASPSPSGRNDPNMVAIDNRFLLFGGVNLTEGFLYDVWIWDRALMTSIETPLVNGPIRLWAAPNPVTHGLLRLSLRLSNAEPAFLDLHSVDGRRVRRVQLNGSSASEMRLDLSGNPAGVYFLTLTQDGWRSTTKFVLQH